MVTKEYENGNPSYQARVVVDYPIRHPEECPFYGEHVIFKKIESEMAYRYDIRIEECCFFSHNKCNPIKCKYLSLSCI